MVKILLLEEIAEPTYKVQRMLKHLIYSGMFDGCRAIGLGLGAIVDCHQMFRGRCQISSSKIFNQWEFQSSIICPSGTAKRIGFGEQTILSFGRKCQSSVCGFGKGRKSRK